MAELFTNFEVNKERRWPIVCWLLEGSLAFHLLVLACILYVPGIRDAFSIAVLLSDTTFVDRDYQKTVIGDEVQLVQLATNKFRYPDGYFATDSQAGVVPPPPPMVFPPAPRVVTSQSAPTPAALPSPSPSATPLPSPTPMQSAVAQTSPSPTPTAGPKGDDQKRTPEEAQAELEKTAASNNFELPKEDEINRQALKDFAKFANDMKLQGKLDLDKPFEIVIEAELDEKGKLKDPRFTKKAGDPNLVELFGQMIAAMNDSGLLGYLKTINKDNPTAKIIFTVKQGENEVLASVESEAASDDSARVLTKNVNLLLSIGAKAREGKDEEVLLRNTSAEQNGKKIIFNFSMPRQAVVDLIKKQLPS